jgi:hypothetical protein
LNEAPPVHHAARQRRDSVVLMAPAHLRTRSIVTFERLK